MRKGEDQEREQRGDRERDKETEEKKGLRDPPLLEFLDPTMCCSPLILQFLRV